MAGATILNRGIGRFAKHLVQTVLMRTPAVPNVDRSAIRAQQAAEARLPVREFVNAVNRAGGTYHKLDWGNELIINGIFDLKKYLHLYGVPDDLRGETALDVGCASGFFAFECARRGAQVTAIDLHEDRWIWFEQARKVGLDVTFIKKDIYDLNPDFGQFDLVICGSLLVHLRDPFGAIQKLRGVCRGEVIIATPAPESAEFDDQPFCKFRGIRTSAGDGEYWHYWEMTPEALAKMLIAAGFSKAEKINRFNLEMEPTASPRLIVPHSVVKGMV